MTQVLLCKLDWHSAMFVGRRASGPPEFDIKRYKRLVCIEAAFKAAITAMTPELGRRVFEVQCGQHLGLLSADGGHAFNGCGERSRPLWDELHVWLQLERTRVPDGSAISKAIGYSLTHWVGLGRFLLDGDAPIDNNHVENRIRPWALGRRNWLFIGSQLAGERAAVVMSLLQSAKLNGHEPWAYLKDVLTRLPTQLNSRIEELMPHKWQPAG